MKTMIHYLYQDIHTCSYRYYLYTIVHMYVCTYNMCMSHVRMVCLQLVVMCVQLVLMCVQLVVVCVQLVVVCVQLVVVCVQLVT